MTAVTKVSKLQTKSNDDRQQLLALLGDMAEHCRTKEPRIRRYLVCIPVDDSDSNSTTVYTAEKYCAASIACAQQAN
jgi:hypothetical protein